MASVTSGGQRYGYTYDSMGNIATFSAPGKGTVTYTYDNQGQLLKAAGDTTYTYTYDGAGNILTASDGTATHSYTYGDTNWKDLLTAFDGNSITYDAIGNPTSYFNGTRWNFTWVNGRRLATASDGTNSLSFAYDAGGLRTSKTVNGTTYRYYYAGGKLMRMTWGTNTIDFFYDASGLPYALKYNGTVYYYITNLQGDVMKLVDASGNVVASYEYDPYGKVLYTTGPVADANPLRYRGYVYDQETGFYYVSSRYYDPEVGRWINADSLLSQGSILGNNMFAYCLNNPVNMADTTGELPFFLVTAAIGAVAGAIIGGVVAAKNGGNVWAGIGIGAAAGGLAGAGLGAAAGVVLAGSATASTAAVVSGAGMIATAVSTGGAGAGLALVADNISRAVNNVGTVLYSGGEQARQAATTFANNTGGTTIDPTVIGQVADAATKVPGADFTTVWSQASAAFCHQASGVVNAFVSNSAYRGADSIFWSVEMPTLLNNPRVTEIIIHIFE